jgi:hypothetical protein
MAKDCFCGCGRKVPFGRRRVTNALGGRLTDDIELFQGALARAPDARYDSDLQRLVATGPPLRDKLRDVIHGTLDRADYPREEGQRWLEEAGEHRKRLAFAMLDEDFAGWSGHTQAELRLAGVEAPAQIVDVADTGMTVNDNPRVLLRLRVEPAGEEPFEVSRTLLVSRVKLPRVGERVTVWFDPEDRSRFTFANADVTDDGAAPAVPVDPVDQIARLAELRDAGALSEEEFAAAKQRLLAGL